MQVAHVPSRHTARKLTAVALLFLVLPPLWTAPAAAAPGSGWGVPFDLKQGGSGGRGYITVVASDRVGGAILAYEDWTGAYYGLFARRFVSGFGIQAEEELDNQYAYSIVADKAPGGDAVVAWVTYNGTAYNASFKVWRPLTGWTATRNISFGYNSPVFGQAAMDGNGQGYAAWTTYNSTFGNYTLWGTSVRPNGTVEAMTRLDNSTTTVSQRLDMDAAAGPGAIVVWASQSAGSTDAFSMRHNGTAWQARRYIEARSGNCNEPKVGMGDDGTALVVWGQVVNYYQIWWATSSTGGAWSPAQYAYSTADYFDIAVLPGGTAAMVTTPWNGSTYVLAVSRYTPGHGFLPPVLSAFTWGYVDWPEIAVDLQGNVYTYGEDIVASAYRAKVEVFSGSSWVSEAQVDDPSFGANQFTLRMAALSTGGLLATWLTYNAGYTAIYARANLYFAPDIVGPWVTIDQNYDGDVTSSQSYWVYGWTEPGSQVTVMGAAAIVTSSGQWYALIHLERGGNWIYAYAIDKAGNYGYSNFIYVTSTDPAPLSAAERAQAGKGGALDPMDIESINYWGAWWPWMRTDRNGNAIAVWYEYSGYRDHAYFNRYTNGSGWGTPVLLQGDPEGYLYGAPRVAMDEGGNATIVWATLDFNGAHSSVWGYFWSAQYSYGAGPYRIDEAERFAFWPDVAVNPATGQHHVVWQQRDENTLNSTLYSRPISYWLSFGAATRIENNTGYSEVPRVAFDGQGRGVVGFRYWNGSQYTAMAARYNGTAWNNTTVLQTSVTYQWVAATAMDAGGNATFAWRNYNGTVYNQYAGRIYANGTYSGATMWLNSTWDWDPEVNALGNGQAFIGMTADRGGQGANAFVGVSGVGNNTWTASVLDGNATDGAGGPKFSKNWDKTTVRAHFDEYYDGYWHPMMREYNVGTGTWGAAQWIGKAGVGGHIPDVAPMPDGGYMAIWIEDNTTLGFGQAVARRVTATDTTPPVLTITNPTGGSSTSLPYTELRGSTEVGARVYVGNLEVPVAANGSFGVAVPLVNGTNSISVRARDINGVWNNTSWIVIFNDPAMALIANLTAQNLALQAAFVAANNSLWAALAGQNASLLAAIAATNASLAAAIAAGDAALLAQLIAQNDSLSNAIASGDAALLADLIAQNDSLSAAIASGDASLLASLLAQNASLLSAMAQGDAALVASLAAQNASLLANIAATNASLLGKLAAQNASVVAALSNLNSTLLAELASRDAELTQLIATTNATLLAQLATQNATLRDLLAATNTSLLASLAAQNSALLATIASTNATLLAELASQNATLWAKLTADNNLLWNSLNATNQVNSNQNSTLQATQDDVDAAQQQAASAGTMALIGTLLGAAGLAVAALAVLMSRKRPPTMDAAPPPSAVEPAEVVADAAVVPPAAPPAAAPHEGGHGHSMAAQGELGSGEV